MFSPKSEIIFKKLIDQKIIDAEGFITMKFLGVEFNLDEKSALGDIIQEWLKNWLIKEKIFFRSNPNTQEPPDFFLSKDNNKHLLEVKVFDFEHSPNFDVANFDTYIRSLQTAPYKIDSDYLIFGYELKNSILKIKKVWLKKIWEICRPSDRFPINTQCKQGKIVNIRPAKWYVKSSKFKPFSTRREFMYALNETIQTYDKLSGEIDKLNWLKTIEKEYKKQVGKNLLD